MDYAAIPSAQQWRAWVEQVDTVVNTVGIVRESAGQSFEVLHHLAPHQLFVACAQAGVRRVVHLSALGADEGARSRYHLSKRTGDAALLALRLDAVVLQPSLVFGLDGLSARFFLQAAASPLLAVPVGAGPVQPVHVDDLAALVVRLVEGAAVASPRLAVVGPEPLAYADYLRQLRAALGLPPARLLRVPHAMVEVASRLARYWPHSLLNPDSWQMLQRGNTASSAPFATALGREPRPVQQFIDVAERDAVATEVRLRRPMALLRWSIAAVWLGTGIVSLGLYPVAESKALLARVGAHGMTGELLLYGAAGLDIVLGAWTMWRPGRRLWWLQIGLISLYTLLISWRLPEFWVHPYGPLLKNLPMLAALGVLLAAERKP
jgi:uncharacterized protein YbjT (DUF2867 family)